MPDSKNSPFQKRSDLEKARASALASLSLREHSILELREKLKRKGYELESIDVVIHECIDSNYLNDMRYAEIYWRQRSSKGYGPQRIQAELKQKGVSSSDINKSSVQPDLDFVEVIQRIYKKKFEDRPVVDFKDKLKRQNYLYQRGFDRDLIETVIK